MEDDDPRSGPPPPACTLPQTAVDTIFQSRLSDYKMWVLLVRTSSSAHLFCDHDSLEALSEIARRFQTLHADTYLAGLWKKNIAQGLAWLVEDPTTNAMRGGPSWSWASRYGQVLLPSLDSRHVYTEQLVILLDAHIQTAGVDPLGAVAKGTLFLRGSIRQCSCVVGSSSIRTSSSRKLTTSETSVVLRDMDDRPCVSGELSLDGIRDGETGEDRELVLASDIHILPVCANRFVDCWDALILKAVPAEPNTYRRIGLLRHMGQSPKLWDRLENVTLKTDLGWIEAAGLQDISLV